MHQNPKDQHPKDRDLPGFTRDSVGHPKPGYHNPGPSGLDIGEDDIWMKTSSARSGLADAIGEAMYGSEEWRERRKRGRRRERVRSVLTAFFTTGCFAVGALLVVASILGLVLLISWLVSLL